MPLACLVFRTGTRPDAAAIAARVGPDFTVSHDSGDAGWIELLRDGLTFDLSGLSPGPEACLPAMPRRYDLADVSGDAPGESLALRPGPHIAGAERLLPVVRTAAGLAMALAELPDVLAVGWLPSKSLCSPAWFRTGVSAWLRGGPFPSLALLGIDRNIDGSLRSAGLDFLIGQEFELIPRTDAPPEQDGRVAMRLADWLVSHGRIDSAREVVLDGVGAIWLDPQPDGALTASCR